MGSWWFYVKLNVVNEYNFWVVYIMLTLNFRQMRNRDAAVKSRERKKEYVRDLELKSRYLEGECRRLERLLQWFSAENQALRLSLHTSNKGFGASMTKQESAVLSESLLLGSLFWFLGIICLFNLSKLFQSTLEAVPLQNESPIPRGVGRNKVLGFVVVVQSSFTKSRRCRGSRTKMKLSFFEAEVSVRDFCIKPSFFEAEVSV